MVINALDHVPHCYTWRDGAVIASLIRAGLSRGEKVVVSFAGVNDMPSSFVNAAFISLLSDYRYDHIRQNLSVVDSNRQINDMIRRRFRAEIERNHAA